jgi:hypothetical protein
MCGSNVSSETPSKEMTKGRIMVYIATSAACVWSGTKTKSHSIAEPRAIATGSDTPLIREPRAQPNCDARAPEAHKEGSQGWST